MCVSSPFARLCDLSRDPPFSFFLRSLGKPRCPPIWRRFRDPPPPPHADLGPVARAWILRRGLRFSFFFATLLNQLSLYQVGYTCCPPLFLLSSGLLPNKQSRPRSSVARAYLFIYFYAGPLIFAAASPSCGASRQKPAILLPQPLLNLFCSAFLTRSSGTGP